MRAAKPRIQDKPIFCYLRSQGKVGEGPRFLSRLGLQVYAAYTENETVMLTVKAQSRESAKSKLWMINPNLRFFK